MVKRLKNGNGHIKLCIADEFHSDRIPVYVFMDCVQTYETEPELKKFFPKKEVHHRHRRSPVVGGFVDPVSGPNAWEMEGYRRRLGDHAPVKL